MPVGVTKPVDALADNAFAYPRGGVVAASASRTTVQDFGDIQPVGASSFEVYVNVTVWTAGSITVTVQGVTPDGVVYPLLASAALVAVGLVRLRISQNIAAVANQVAQDIVPDTIRIHVAVADATPITYSISAVAAL